MRASQLAALCSCSHCTRCATHADCCGRCACIPAADRRGRRASPGGRVAGSAEPVRARRASASARPAKVRTRRHRLRRLPDLGEDSSGGAYGKVRTEYGPDASPRRPSAPEAAPDIAPGERSGEPATFHAFQGGDPSTKGRRLYSSDRTTAVRRTAARPPARRSADRGRSPRVRTSRGRGRRATGGRTRKL